MLPTTTTTTTTAATTGAAADAPLAGHAAVVEENNEAGTGVPAVPKRGRGEQDDVNNVNDVPVPRKGLKSAQPAVRYLFVNSTQQLEPVQSSTRDALSFLAHELHDPVPVEQFGSNAAEAEQLVHILREGQECIIVAEGDGVWIAMDAALLLHRISSFSANLVFMLQPNQQQFEADRQRSFAHQALLDSFASVANKRQWSYQFDASAEWIQDQLSELREKISHTQAMLKHRSHAVEQLKGGLEFTLALAVDERSSRTCISIYGGHSLEEAHLIDRIECVTLVEGLRSTLEPIVSGRQQVLPQFKFHLFGHKRECNVAKLLIWRLLEGKLGGEGIAINRSEAPQWSRYESLLSSGAASAHRDTTYLSQQAFSDMVDEFRILAKDISGEVELPSAPLPSTPAIALWGRASVGKSTLSNLLIGRKILSVSPDVCTSVPTFIVMCPDGDVEHSVIDWITKNDLARQLAIEHKYIADLENELRELDKKANEESVITQGARAMISLGVKALATLGRGDPSIDVDRARISLRAEIQNRKRMIVSLQQKFVSFCKSDQTRVSDVDYESLKGYLHEKKSPYKGLIKRVTIYLKADILRHITLLDTAGLPPISIAHATGSAALEAAAAREIRERKTIEAINTAAAWVYMISANAPLQEMQDCLENDVARLSQGQAASSGVILLTQADSKAVIKSDKPLVPAIISKAQTWAAGRAKTVLPVTAFFSALVHPDLVVPDNLTPEELANRADLWFKTLRGKPLVEEAGGPGSHNGGGGRLFSKGRMTGGAKIDLFTGTHRCFGLEDQDQAFSDCILELSVLPTLVHLLETLVAPSAIARERAAVIAGYLNLCQMEGLKAQDKVATLTAEISQGKEREARIQGLNELLRTVREECDVIRTALDSVKERFQVLKENVLDMFDEACDGLLENALRKATKYVQDNKGMFWTIGLEVSSWNDFEKPLLDKAVRLIDAHALTAELLSDNVLLANILGSNEAKYTLENVLGGMGCISRHVGGQPIIYDERLFMWGADAEKSFIDRFRAAAARSRSIIRDGLEESLEMYGGSAIGIVKDCKRSLEVRRDNLWTEMQRILDATSWRAKEQIIMDLRNAQDLFKRWRETHKAIHTASLPILLDARLNH
jgi:hypothetical protein